MAKWQTYYKIVTPKPGTETVTDSQFIGDQSAYGSYTWYQRLIQGSASRISRYREYDLMDADVDLNRALDIIAEEITGNNPKNKEPIEIEAESDDELDATTIETLKHALKRWNKIHNWRTRLFKLARTMVKYGDIFFLRKEPFKKWEYVNPKNVLAAIVSEDDFTDVQAWQIKQDLKKPAGGYGQGFFFKSTGEYSEIVKAEKIVRFALNDDMSDSAPFGESILKSVYKTFKQKELLEDAILIYRIQRAPERRVFYIDVGKMPPNRVKQFLENIKNEIKQKKVPSGLFGPKAQQDIDSVYNPQSMSEDFFLAQRPDGRGSKVEVLPGGQALGELSDLEYFHDKIFRGLRIPASYMKRGQENAVYNDDKVGVAYIEELRFSLFIERLQTYIESSFDYEFKKFIKSKGIYIDEELYELRLPAPSNFGVYRQQEVDAALLGSYSSSDAIAYISKRFGLIKYLQLTEDELVENEKKVAEERGIDYDEEHPEKSWPQIYGPVPEEGMGVGAGGAMGGDFGMTAGPLPGEEGAIPGEEGAVPGAAAPAAGGAAPAGPPAGPPAA